MTPPQRINVHLNESDVRKDLVSLLTDMDKIRRESIAEGTIKRKEEYASLAYRLASCFKGLSQKEFQPRIAALEQSIAKDERLGNYDRLQTSYWVEYEGGNAFLQNLSQLALDFFQPEDFVRFFEQTGEYHLLQALRVLAKETASLVQKGLSMDEVLSSVDVEEMNNPLALARAYERCGYLTAKLKSKQAGNQAQSLQQQGLDARPEEGSITLRFKEMPAAKFLHQVFGYQNIKRAGSYYTARSKEGLRLLSLQGTPLSVQGEEYFQRIKEQEVEGKVVLQIEQNRKFAYLAEEGLLFNRWFEQPLTAELMKIIQSMEKKYGHDLASWLLNSAVPLQELENLSKKNVDAVYQTGVKPTRLLLTQASALASQVDDFGKFVQTYNNHLQGVELPGSPSFWEMYDTIPEATALKELEVAVLAYNTHGEDKLKHLLHAYQERRTSHQQVQTLMLSMLDYVATISEDFPHA